MQVQKHEQVRIGVLIPGYNVEETLPSVLSELDDLEIRIHEKIFRFLFVNNKSTDNTESVFFEQRKRSKNIPDKLYMASNIANYGLGGSLRIGFRHFLELDVTHIIVVHADGQGNARDIVENFIKVLDRTPEIDFVMASRFMTGANLAGYNRIRIIGNKFFNFLTWVITGCNMSDSGCGIVCISADLLRRMNFDDLGNSLYFNPMLNVLIHAEAGCFNF